MKRWGSMLLLVLAIAGGVVALAISLSQLSSASAEQRHQALLRCEAGNSFRDAERGLWDKLFSYPPAQKLTKQQQRQLADFRNYIAKTFAHIDCATGKPNIAPPPPPAPPLPSANVEVKVNPKTQTRTVTVTVPGPTRYITRTIVICRRPNGRPC